MLFTETHLKNIIMEVLEKELQFKARPINEAEDPLHANAMAAWEVPGRPASLRKTKKGKKE